MKKVLSIVVLLIPFITLQAQNKEKGPWWPHPLWGDGDQAGASNWITPEKIVQSFKLVETGKVYELGHLYEPSMPLFGKRSYKMETTMAASGGPFGKNNLIYNEEFLTTEIGQVGTQFDGLGHVGSQLKFDDGSVKDVYYNGYTGDELYSESGLKKLGIEHLKPIITKGILLDIAGYKEVDVLAHSYEVTLGDVRGAIKKQGLTKSDIENGHAIFFRYGWSKLWNNPEVYNTNPPGIGLEVAKWLVSKNIAMVGSDQFGTEVLPNPNPDLESPVHQFLIMQNGILNLENLNLEELAMDKASTFLFIFTPTQFKGATGSPGRPIAIK
ncbi:MAG: cyclase family protein [Flavobacteriaceae bacterium]